MAAKTLREWRYEKALSQRELSEISGVAVYTIARVESGKVVPNMRTIRKLSEALGVQPSEIKEYARTLKRVQNARPFRKVKAITDE